jgi:hypothetical protein
MEFSSFSLQCIMDSLFLTKNSLRLLESVVDEFAATKASKQDDGKNQTTV